MKCKHLFVIMLGLSLNLFSQNISEVIYIDLNSSSKSLSEIENEVKLITKSNSSFLLYIANGEEPIYTSLPSDINSSIEQMYLLNARSSNFNFDVSNINTLLRKNGFVKNINTISSDSSLGSQLNFHFFYNTKEYKNDVYSQFIKKLLLTNRLHYSNGNIHEDISLYIYKNNNDFTSIIKEKL